MASTPQDPSKSIPSDMQIEERRKVESDQSSSDLGKLETNKMPTSNEDWTRMLLKIATQRS